MFTKPTFENNLYMRIFRWLYIGFALNISFWVVNTPYTLTSMFLAVDPRNLLWFALALLLIGPSMISLLAAIDRFAEHKDIDPVKDFCYFLRTFAVRGFLYWLIGWLGSVIAIVDILFAVQFESGKWLVPFFLLLGMLSIALSINAWYFQVRNPKAAKKDVLRTALFFTLKKWPVSLLATCLFVAVFVALILKPQFGFTLFPVLFFGLLYLNLRKFQIK